MDPEHFDTNPDATLIYGFDGDPDLAFISIEAM